MDSSAPSLVGEKQLQGIGEVQTAIKSLQEQVGASKVSWGAGPPPEDSNAERCNALWALSSSSSPVPSLSPSRTPSVGVPPTGPQG